MISPFKVGDRVIVTRKVKTQKGWDTEAFRNGAERLTVESKPPKSNPYASMALF